MSVSVIVSICYSVKLTLVCLIALPLAIASVIIESRFGGCGIAKKCILRGIVNIYVIPLQVHIKIDHNWEDIAWKWNENRFGSRHQYSNGGQSKYVAIGKNWFWAVIVCVCFLNEFSLIFLGQEKHMIERYANEMNRVENLIRKKIVWRGLVSSFAKHIPPFAYAFGFYYGARLIADNEMNFKDVIKLVKII